MINQNTSKDVTRQIAPWRSILGYSVANLGFSESLELIVQRIAARQFTPVTFLNAHNANVANADARFAIALHGFLVLPDGIGVDLASKSFHGQAFKANLNGTDLIPALFNYCIKPLKIALLGSRPEVIKAALEAFQKETPWHHFEIVSDGFFKESELPFIKQRLKNIHPDVLIVAMGVPRQEEFITNNIGPEHCTIPIAVGALLDIHTGTIPRAPVWVRNMRIEWAYRLWREPKRLWYRYIIGNPRFMWHVFRSYFSQNSADSGDAQSGNKADTKS